MFDYFVGFLKIWASLVAGGALLILFRSDAFRVGEDIDSYFYKKPFHIKIVTVVLLILVVPFSIPYSLANILTNKRK